MVDVTVITPSSQVTSVQPGGGGQSNSSQAILHPGATLAGVITGKDTSGNFLLRTDSGTFALRSSAPLTYNSDVVIQLGSNGNNARVISVNGESFANYAAAQPETTDSLSPSLLATFSQATQSSGEVISPPTTPLVTVEATVLSTAPQTNTSITPTVSLPPQGSNVTLQITLPAFNNSVPTGAVTETAVAPTSTVASNISVVVAAPAPAVAAANVSAPEVTTSAATTVPLTPSVASTPTGINTVAPANTTVTALSDAPAASAVITATAVQSAPSSADATPQNTSAAQSSQYAAYSKQPASAVIVENTSTSAPSTASAPTSTSSTTSLPAQVISSSAAALPSNIVVLSTPAGNITLQTNGPTPLNTLPEGSSLTINIPASAASIVNTPISLPALAAGWQTLAEIVNVLGGTSDSTATALTNSQLPQLGQTNFTAASLSMISSLGQGNIQAVLGEAAVAQLKDKGRTDLIQRAGAELGLLKSAADIDAPVTTAGRSTSTWQAIFLPFMYMEEIQQARLYVKRDSEKEKEKEQGKKRAPETRFVIEVDLSEMGTVQFDGLVQKEKKSSEFDLVIRTHTPFTTSQKNEIAQIYTNTGQLTGFRGNLTFQVMQNFSVNPLEDMVTSSSAITI